MKGFPESLPVDPAKQGQMLEVVNRLRSTPHLAAELSRASLARQGKFFVIQRVVQLPGRFEPLHWHDTYEIGCIQWGKCLIKVGEQSHFAKSGQVYVVNSLEPHMAYALDEACCLFVVHFHPDLVEDGWLARLGCQARLPFTPDFATFHGPLIPIDDPITQHLLALLQQIQAQEEQKGCAWEIIAGGLLLQAVGILVRRLLDSTGNSLKLNQRRAKALQIIRPLLSFIETNYAQPLSLADMSKVIHVSPSYCCALFREAINTTPIAYRNARRLSEAIVRLQQTEATILDIAYSVGFNNVQEFNRIFRRVYGMTPREFRNKCAPATVSL